MKRQFIYACLLLGAVSFSSCNDFLTEELKGAYNTESFYTNQESAMKAIDGVYNSLSFTTSNNMIWVFGDVASDDSEKGGNPGDQADIRLIDEFNVSPDNGVINTYWQFAYETVSRTNNVISYVPGIYMDSNLKNRIVGEAKFIRALTYFNLTNVWGKVPLKLQPQNNQTAIYVPLSEVTDIYTQIEKDLNDAIAVLPVSYNAEDKGRATRGAAYALLAKAQLYQRKWSDCLGSINELEKTGLYSLASDYSTLFQSGNENSPEVLFAIRHLNDQNPGLGNILNVWFAPATAEEGGYYFNAPTGGYVSAFDEKTTTGQDDPRLDASIGRDGKPWLNGETFSASWSPTGYLVKKHDQPLSEVAAGRKGDGYLAYIYLRYADILLMKAEAMNESGNLEGAASAINQVRSRAQLGTVNATGQGGMRIAIQKERRRELGFEFHRFFDLMRWGKEVATDALGPNFKWTEPRYYFPLPQAELDANTAIK